MKLVQLLLFFVFLVFASLLVQGADRINNVEPNPFYMGRVSHHDRLLQEALFDKRNFQPGEDHETEVYHFEESSGIFRWQKSKFRLHHHFLNLDLTLGVQRIQCSPLKKVLALHTTNASLAHSIHEGHYLYFGRGWASGCHLHHDKGIEGQNLFEVTEVVSVRKQKFFWRVVTTIRPGDPMEIFEEGEFNIYQENIRSPNSRKFEAAFFEEEEDVPSEDHEGHIDNFRKRNLPENIHQILQQIQEEDERGEGEGRRVSQGERGRERRQMIKRSIWGWIKDKATSAGRAITKTVTKAVEKAKESGKKAVKFLKEKGTQAYQWVKNKLASAIDGTYTKSFHPELPLKIRQTFGPLSLSGQLKFGVNIAVSFTIKSFKLSRFHFEIIGSASASIGATISAGKFKQISFELPAKAEANFNIPTPVPGLFFQINPYLKVGGSVSASFSLQASLGSISASGQVGAAADYTPGPGWNVRPITSFSWRLTKPSLGQAEASLNLQVIPKVGISFGASALGILNLRGGPQLQLPLTVSLTASVSCPLGFRWSFTIGLAIHFDFSIFSKAMFEKEFSKNLIPAKGDGYCLLGSGTPALPSSGGGGRKTSGKKKAAGKKKTKTGGKKKGGKKKTSGKKKTAGSKKTAGRKTAGKVKPTTKRRVKSTKRKTFFHSK